MNTAGRKANPPLSLQFCLMRAEGIVWSWQRRCVYPLQLQCLWFTENTRTSNKWNSTSIHAAPVSVPSTSPAEHASLASRVSDRKHLHWRHNTFRDSWKLRVHSEILWWAGKVSGVSVANLLGTTRYVYETRSFSIKQHFREDDFYRVASCSVKEVYRRFRWYYHHHDHDGDNKHVWNVCQRLRDYTVQHPRRRLLVRINSI
jgi:hypothetical protein